MIDDEGGFDPWGNHYNDFDTNIDFFFKNYKWIRYIYDFGDDWMFTIDVVKIVSVENYFKPHVIGSKGKVKQY